LAEALSYQLARELTVLTDLTCDARSFGEAFHVGAAVLLCPDARWRVVNGSEQSRKHASAFLDCCAPNRSHEGGGKGASEATSLVKREFERNAIAALTRLRTNWLSASDEFLRPLRAFADRWVSPIRDRKLLIWNRGRDDYQSERNTTPKLRGQLTSLARDLRLAPILIGHPIGAPRSPCDLTGLWEDEVFRKSPYLSQLAFVDLLCREYGVVASVGNRSGGMDGPALLGLPTIYLEDPSANELSQKRMQAWVNVVPGYRRQVLNDTDADGPYLTPEDSTQLSGLVRDLLGESRRPSGAVWLRRQRRSRRLGRT
jgi:hypothetical protein